MTHLERLGFAVIGFMVAMIGVWIRLRGRDRRGLSGCGRAAWEVLKRIEV
jgi:hypothetical protein